VSPFLPFNAVSSAVNGSFSDQISWSLDERENLVGSVEEKHVNYSLILDAIRNRQPEVLLR